MFGDSPLFGAGPALALASLLTLGGCRSLSEITTPLPASLAVEPLPAPGPELKGEGWLRQDLRFPCGDEGEAPTEAPLCAGWLYLPTGASAPPPVVVMAHGFSGQRDMSLPATAERFAQAGLAAFVFDYRGWGDSGGLPRYTIVAERQVADYLSAISFLRGLEQVDGARVAAWGTSFSGGLVLMVAARDPGVAAVVAQVPMSDGRAEPPLEHDKDEPVGALLRVAFKDKFREIGGKERLYVWAFPEPGEVGVLMGEQAGAAKGELVPEGSSWPNLLAPAILVDFNEVRPDKEAPKVACPALFVVADQDLYVNNEATLRVAATMPQAEVVHVGGGHFDVYAGESFERVVAAELAFLGEQLGVEEADAAEVLEVPAMPVEADAG